MAKGPVGLTIAAVAEQMGITNGGVQYSFRSKEALIGAMFDRWVQDHAACIEELCPNPRDGHDLANAHIVSTSNYDARSRRRAPSLMVSVLNSPQHMALTRAWYRDRVNDIDASTTQGRRLRLAFFAMEGAFLLRLFGLIEIPSEEWDSIVADVMELIEGEDSVAASPIESRAA